MAENKIVTLNVKGKNGIVHVPFEVIKDLGNNRYILYAQERLCVGTRHNYGLWVLTRIIDVLDVSLNEESIHCKETKNEDLVITS